MSFRCWWHGHIWSRWRTAMAGSYLFAERSCATCGKCERRDAWE